jgi:hypothetical protein
MTKMEFVVRRAANDTVIVHAHILAHADWSH